MKKIRIVALGDSITNGKGIGDVEEEDTYRHLLQVDLARMLKCNVEVINAGVNGDITTTAIPRLERDVLQYKPDYVTIMFGVNDAGFYRPINDSMADTPRVTEQDFKINLNYIIDAIQQIGSKPILVTPLPMNQFYAHKDFPAYLENGLNYLVNKYSDIIREISANRNMPLIDTNKAFNDDPDTYKLIPDGIHPNKCGHKFIADIFISVFLKLLS
ncbi:MAG: SGNH/GDSL hydrolase family protein [bacterium]